MGSVPTTRTADVLLEVLKSVSPVPHKTELLFHVGTAHVIAEVDLLGDKEIPPGKTAPARLHFETPLVLLAGDRFVLRSFCSPSHSRGGDRCSTLCRGVELRIGGKKGEKKNGA